MNPLQLLYHYERAKRLRFFDANALQAHQTRAIARFMRDVLPKSPYFAPYAHGQLADIPLMDKQIMMHNFNAMNTAGLTLDDVLSCAIAAERSRDFSPTIQGYSVGLSSGTTGQRGVFIVSPAEQAMWAGTILAKLLPDGLLAKERIGFFLRAHNNLYKAVNTLTIRLKFFDLFDDFSRNLTQLYQLNPTIIVAPASVLRVIATDTAADRLQPKKVISVAEVLDEQTRALLSERFGVVHEVYQATEGFLGCTCPHGRLHLNEAYIHIEKSWLDGQRFTPIITDFHRTSQPIVRYQLDDVLHIGDACPCGSAETVIHRIQGRMGDVLRLPSRDGGRLPVFADVCERVFAVHLPAQMDYELTQSADVITLSVAGEPQHAHACQQALINAWRALRVDTDSLTWHIHHHIASHIIHQKRRRIRNLTPSS